MFVLIEVYDCCRCLFSYRYMVVVDVCSHRGIWLLEMFVLIEVYGCCKHFVRPSLDVMGRIVKIFFIECNYIINDFLTHEKSQL